MSLQTDGSNPELPPADPIADALCSNSGDDRHLPFDWNGWGIGVEAELVPTERRPGESIVAWRLGVRTIVERY